MLRLSAMTRFDRRISMRLIAAPAGACALALAACSSSSTSSASSSPTPSAAAASTVTLVVYSAQGYDSAMTKAFTAATGLDTQGLLLKGSSPASSGTAWALSQSRPTRATPRPGSR